MIPYSPLGGGFLTGKYSREESAPEGSRGETSGRIQGYLSDDRNFDLLDTMRELGEAHGKSITQVALGWQLSQPAITAPIIGARTLDQLEESLGAVGFRLTDDDMAALDQASQHTAA